MTAIPLTPQPLTPAAPPVCLGCGQPTYWLFCSTCSARLDSDPPFLPIHLALDPTAPDGPATDALGRTWHRWPDEPCSFCTLCGQATPGGWWCPALGLYLCPAHVTTGEVAA
jgi:hypothetical protein